jgi:ATP-dependent RNA helicase DeaD
LTVPNIEQIYFEVKENSKLEMLARAIDIYDPKLALVFCNTKRKVDDVVVNLQARGYFADAIHGDMSQSQRDRVMAKFRKGAVEILVATDVAARGIDVENVEAVFNYDIPQDEEYYVHRIGRTGRAGRAGRAFSFVAGKDIFKIRDIQRYAKVDIKRQAVPTIKDVEEIRLNQLLVKVKENIGSNDLSKYIAKIEVLIGTEYTSLDAAAALLKTLMINTFAAKEERDGERNIDAQGTDTGAEPGMARLFMSVGRSQNIRPGDILGAVAGETGLEGKLIGSIDVHDRFSFVEVPLEHTKQVISVMKTKYIKGHKINIELANKK